MEFITLERVIKTVHALHSRQTMYRAYSQEGHLHKNIIHKGTENEVYTIMQLIQCFT